MKNNDYHNLLLQSLPESYKEWFQEERKYLEKIITKNSSVLEVGSGDGRSVVDILPITRNITGIDHDEKAIEESRAKFSEYETVQFLKADAQQLPFGNQEFDFVICMTSFANFADDKAVILQEMKRVLKDSGKIVVSVFSQNALPERIKVYEALNVPISEIKEDGTVIFSESLGDNISEQFTRQQLVDIFSSANLTIENITEVNIAYLCTLSNQ